MLWFQLFPDVAGSNVIKGLPTGTVEECYSIGVERRAIVWDLGLGTWFPDNVHFCAVPMSPQPGHRMVLLLISLPKDISPEIFISFGYLM